jgi:biotin carboxyl carrier protein
VTIDGREREVSIEGEGAALRVRLDGREVPVDFRRLGEATGHLILGGRSFLFTRLQDGEHVLLQGPHGAHAVGVESERDRMARRARPAASEGGALTVRSVMPGIVTRVAVAAGDLVEAGAPLLWVEAMKMENEVRAPRAGVVRQVHVAAGQTVAAGAPLITLEG